ncbi:hypothetical protein GCM10027060_26360 [Nesterenkonia halophila]
MTRPTPKKTSLNTQHPGEPPEEQPATQTAEEPPAQPPAAGEAPQETTGSKQTGKPKYPPKMSIYQDPADTDRIRGAIIHTMGQEGYRTLSQFVNSAVMEEVRRLEEKYNNGQPFPPVSAKGFPKGRPMGE